MIHPREGWKDNFKEMAKNGDDNLLDVVPGYQTEWDKQEWEWNS